TLGARHFGHRHDLRAPRLAVLTVREHDVGRAHANGSPSDGVEKSAARGSARCEATTLRRLEKIDSVRPGYCCSHACSIFLISWRCMFSCEPQSVQGISGNSRARA